MIENYLHHWLHQARAAELRAAADAYRVATAVDRRTRAHRQRGGRRCHPWWRRLLNRVRRTRCPDCRRCLPAASTGHGPRAATG